MPGSDWLEALVPRGPNEGKRRLDLETDFVRIEIQSALERKNISLIPVLLKDAQMPGREELPEELRPLIYRNAANVRDGEDLRTLISDIDGALENLRNVPDLVKPEPAAISHQEEVTQTQPSVVLRVTPKPQDVVPGQVVTWTVYLRNDGDEALQDVEVRRAGRRLAPVFSLMPGKGRRFRFETSYRAAGRKTARVKLEAVGIRGQSMSAEAENAMVVHEPSPPPVRRTRAKATPPAKPSPPPRKTKAKSEPASRSDKATSARHSPAGQTEQDRERALWSNALSKNTSGAFDHYLSNSRLLWFEKEATSWGRTAPGTRGTKPASAPRRSRKRRANSPAPKSQKPSPTDFLEAEDYERKLWSWACSLDTPASYREYLELSPLKWFEPEARERARS